MVNVFPLGQILAYQFFEPFRDARAEYGMRILDIFQYFGAGEGKYGVRDLLAIVVQFFRGVQPEIGCKVVMIVFEKQVVGQKVSERVFECGYISVDFGGELFPVFGFYHVLCFAVNVFDEKRNIYVGLHESGKLSFCIVGVQKLVFPFSECRH